MKRVYSHSLKQMPLSVIFSALSDPIRLEIVLNLLERKEVSCGQCTRQIPKSTMSHHFKVLREAGLIQRREAGTVHYLSLRVEEVEARLPGFFAALARARKPF